MNQEKIGKFIANLRKEKNITQEQLAEQLNIGREAISKWERGKTIPDYNVLKELCNFFGISVDELLSGEKNPKESIALELYKERFKLKRKITYIVIVCFLLVILFLSYYFFNQFKSVNIYIISGDNPNFEITNGLLVKTNENIYFNLNVNSKLNYDIESLELYSLVNGKKQFIKKSADKSLFFIDYDGYNEYVDLSNTELLKNLYIKVSYNKNHTHQEEEIQLNCIKDYVNDSFFKIKEKKSASPFSQESSSNSTITTNKIDKEKLLKVIKDSFKKQDDGYIFQIEKDKLRYSYTYFPDEESMYLSVNSGDKLIEEYSYYLKLDSITYTKYTDNLEILFSFTYENDNYKCDIGNCLNMTAISSKFIDNLLSL